jgi:sugar/nucleoside kinase (ribokinase family)
LIADEVDVLFGNEAELLSLYETDTFEYAVAELRRDCTVAAITRSEHGSVVVTPDAVLTVPAKPVEQVLDTTGAGDLYAAGFLYGYTRGLRSDATWFIVRMAGIRFSSPEVRKPFILWLFFAKT